MQSVRRALGVLGAAAALFASAGARADDADVIEYRRHIMNTLNEQSGALGEILATAVPNDNAVAHLETIALTASLALKAFEPKVLGGEARPEVWTHWPDFSKRMQELADRTAAAAKAAKTQGKVDSASVLEVLTCKACHDVYRADKHKKHDGRFEP